MRSPWLAALAVLVPCPAVAQAPGWAELWRVAATTVAGPASLQAGPTATLWNPAAVMDRPGLALGVEVFQTSSILGLAGVVGGLTHRLTPALGVGAMVGRLGVEDLIRTTTSPTSREGDIPVYSQFAAVAAGAVVAGVQAGATVRLHDARFDTASEGGVTADVGIRFRPVRGLTVAAATRFADPVLRQQTGTSYQAAAELALTTATIWGSRFLVIGQYGVAHEQRAGLEHALSAGLALDNRLRVDWGFTYEGGYQTDAWRPTLAVWFRTGRYRIAVARSDGLNGLGAAFRLGLSADVTR